MQYFYKQKTPRELDTNKTIFFADSQVHRRLLHDDAFGVGEALNETAYGKGLVARGKHFLIFGSKTDQHPTLEGRERMLQNRVLVPNWLFFDDVSSTSYDDWMKKYTNIVSALNKICE